MYYTTGGYKVEDDTQEITARFLEFDLLAKGRFEAGGVGIQVFAGPALLYGIGEWAFDIPGFIVADLDKDERDDNDVRNTYLAAVAGAGVVFGGIGPGQLGVEARGRIGFQNFDSEDNFVQKGASILVLASYGFRIQ